MAISVDKVATEVRKIIKGSGYRLEMFTEDGNSTLDDRTARRFFVKPSNIMITIDEKEGMLKLHKPDEVPLAEVDGLRRTLKNVAQKNRLNFDFRSFGHTLEPKDYVHQAVQSMNDEELKMNKMAEGMSPMSGSTKSSYQLVDDNVKLIVRHTKAVDEAVRGSRSRNIKALFIENGAGERFQYPHIHLAGARAMARHVSMGGTPYDSVGTHIGKLSEDYKKLQKFIRYAKSSNVVNEDTAEIVEAIKSRYYDIRKNLSQLSGVKGYAHQVEAIHEDAYEATDDKVTELRNMFTAKTFDESLEEVLPLISQILEYRIKKDDPSQQPVGDQMTPELLKMKAEDVEFHEPTESQDEYASGNIMKFATQVDEVAYKVGELAGRVTDDVLTSFLARMSQRLQERDQSLASDEGREELDVVHTVLKRADEAGIFAKKDSAQSDDSTDDGNPAEMPDDLYDEGKQFESWLDSIAGDKALFEDVGISEDDFVDFNRALATARSRMDTLPRMGDGAPLIRRVKGMCEEVAGEYDIDKDNLYAALSGEEIVNEEEPRIDHTDDDIDRVMAGYGEPTVEPVIETSPRPEAEHILTAIETTEKFAGNTSGFYDWLKIYADENDIDPDELANIPDVQDAVRVNTAESEELDRVRHLAGV